MSLLSKMSAAVGLHGAKVEIVELGGNTFHWNDTVRGVLTLSGGGADQVVDELSARLICQTWRPARNGYEPSFAYHGETLLASGLAVKANTEQQFAFSVTLPQFTAPSGLDELSKSVDWFVQGVAHLHHAVDASGEAGITVVCPDALEALASAVERAAPVQTHLRYLRHYGAATVAFVFEPMEEGRSHIEDVKMEVEEKEGQVIGSLQINPQPHSLVGQLRSLAEKDGLRYDIAFPVSALSPVHSEVVARMQQWFAPVMRENR